MALVFCTLQNEDVDFWDPHCELSPPVIEGRLGNYDQVRPWYRADKAQVSQEGDSLESLAQSHFISQYTRNAILME